MKVTLLCIIFLVFALSCQPSAAIDANLSVKTLNGKIEEKNQPAVTPTPKTADDRINSKYPLLWSADVSVEDFTDTENPLKLYSYDDDEISDAPDKNSPYFQARKGVEVDLMNCGGYLASGRVYSSNEKSNFPPPNWRLKIAPGTIAKDVEAKIKRCNIYTENGVPSKDKFGSRFFAVAPHKDSRRNVTIGEINTKELFSSLPKPTKKFLNAKPAITAGRTLNDLSSSAFDVWTDLDGDGKIDLIVVSAMSDEEHSSGSVLLLVEGKWISIGSVQPA